MHINLGARAQSAAAEFFNSIGPKLSVRFWQDRANSRHHAALALFLSTTTQASRCQAPDAARYFRNTLNE